MKQTIVELPGITLWYYPDKKVIQHQMTKYPGREVLESALNQGLEIIKTRGADKWLSDDRKSGALPKYHHEWGQNVWGPAAAAAGWKYWALCPPKELLGSSNMQRLVEIYSVLGVTVKTFEEPNAAMLWLTTRE